ncbi:ABC transporter permease [Microbacterium cremeum]|uniref:ABC transporter permease n=1 Tax=Microbacterium cremeum TaxID=2782169 RepID=UPI001886EBC5|nr:ABC transporter permease [Microbacterium cremeum]
MNAAIPVELRKLLRSPVGVVATAAVVLGVTGLSGGMLWAAASGDPQILAKLGPGAVGGWEGLFATAAQITAAGGLVAYGVVLSWLLAREFADGTITGLFALPIGRGALAVAKLAVYIAWSVVVSGLLVVALAVLGLASGLEPPGDGIWSGLARQFVLGILTAAIALPVAWVASLTRSLLGGVATTIGLVVVAQVGVIAGAEAWLPLAAPALWAMSAGSAATPVQLSLSVVFGACFAAATTVVWHRLQLDR